jgi:heme oxygenase (biliverdin-IX-beta and delta-forming)
MTQPMIHIEREPSSRRAGSRDILSRLKLETAAEHAAIEAATRIMRPDIGVPDYRGYLERTYGFYQPVEQMLEHMGVWPALELDGAARVKLPLLGRDLTELGGDPSALPICAAPPQLAGLPEAVGCAYVLEGSTLGGRVISRHVQTRLGPQVPHRFLDAYGADIGERWQAFRAALRWFADSRETENRVITGARQTFESFTRWLTPLD